MFHRELYDPCSYLAGRILCEESLFWYSDLTIDCELYQDRAFIPLFEVDWGGDAALKTEAESVCSGSGATQNTQNCLFDYFVTRDAELAQATLETEAVNVQLRDTLSRFT